MNVQVLFIVVFLRAVCALKWSRGWVRCSAFDSWFCPLGCWSLGFVFEYFAKFWDFRVWDFEFAKFGLSYYFFNLDKSLILTGELNQAHMCRPEPCDSHSCCAHTVKWTAHRSSTHWCFWQHMVIQLCLPQRYMCQP